MIKYWIKKSVHIVFSFIFLNFIVQYVHAGVQKFSKNLGATSEFLAPDGWHAASSVLRIHKY